MNDLEKRIGKLITIDGGDRSGKQTQAILLYERLKSEGYKAHFLDFPQYETLSGKLVSKYLAGAYGTKEQIGAEIPSVLYALNRFEKKKFMLHLLEKREICVLDRYREANEVYQSAKLPSSQRDAFLEWLDHLESGILGLPRSDIVLYLDVPYDYAQQLAQKEEQETGKKLDIHEKDKEYQKEVIKTYLELAERRKWLVITCIEKGVLLSKEIIAERVWEGVQPQLPKQ